MTKRRAGKKIQKQTPSKKIELTPLERKADKILNIMAPEMYVGGPAEAKIFTAFIRIKTRMSELRKIRPDPSELKKTLLENFLGGKKNFQKKVAGINQYLEGKGRADLKLTPDEIIKLIVE